MNKQIATFGAGCFWSVQESFRTTPGVMTTMAAYSGGDAPEPTYEAVCRGNTGHAEVVHISYDADQISYDKLLDIFFSLHDPTQVNRQGPDIGEQYRSVIFYHTPEQQAAAEAYKQALNTSGRFKKPVVTAIEPAKEIYEAEEYHQEYERKRQGT